MMGAKGTYPAPRERRRERGRTSKAPPRSVTPEPAQGGTVAACFNMTGGGEGANLSPPLAAARRDYLTRKAAHEKAAAELARSPGVLDLEQAEHYSQEAADTAYGAFARLAHGEGLTACLCGALKKERGKGKSRKAGAPKGATRQSRSAR